MQKVKEFKFSVETDKNDDCHFKVHADGEPYLEFTTYQLEMLAVFQRLTNSIAKGRKREITIKFDDEESSECTEEQPQH